MCRRAATYYSDSGPRTVLDVDCTVAPELLTVRGIDSLNAVEPCGTGCPKPVLAMQKLTIERMSQVGGGRHMRLRLRCGHHAINAIYFSATPEMASVQMGDVVDVAFNPQVNEFRGERTVQMNVLDIRPNCCAPCSPEAGAYRKLRTDTLTAEEATALLPERATLTTVWRYLDSVGHPIKEDPLCLCRKIVRWSGRALSLGQLLTCLDIFQDVGLLRYERQHKHTTVELTYGAEKTDLNLSKTMQTLLRVKES